MDSFSVGDKIITKKGLFFQGDDLSERLGIVLNTNSYILISIDNYEYGPIKCFRHELTAIEQDEQLEFDWAGHL